MKGSGIGPAILLMTMVQLGCSALEEHVLFMTKTNVGIDVDSTPPTAEISIARREAVLEPTFEGGQTPPVLASFRSAATGLLGGLIYDISATFAGGDAATTMTKLYGDETADPEKIEPSALCLSEQPKSKRNFSPDKDLGLGTSGEYRPFVFGTDTTFGLKLAWSGMTAQIPDTVRLGYNRKEIAWAPIFVSREECTDPVSKVKKPFRANVSSFLATIDHEGQGTSLEDSGFGHLQYFATGKAASNLSLREEVRRAMLKKIYPDLVPAVEYKSPDKNGRCIKTWIDSDKNANLPKIKNWMKGKKLSIWVTDLIRATDYANDRATAVSELGIACP
ncbi:MAG: hypothetical protein ABI618_06210 [Nitrospirota bacterium]